MAVMTCPHCQGSFLVGEELAAQQRAEADIIEGRVRSFDTADDVMNYLLVRRERAAIAARLRVLCVTARDLNEFLALANELEEK